MNSDRDLRICRTWRGCFSRYLAPLARCEVLRRLLALNLETTAHKWGMIGSEAAFLLIYRRKKLEFLLIIRIKCQYHET